MFYYVPKRLRAKLTLRYRMGTFLGNSQSSNEAYIAIANGDVIKSRTIVRVVEGSRWNTNAVLGVVGIPGKLTPQQSVDANAEVEELIDPHENADETRGHMDDVDECIVIGSEKMKVMDRQIRITLKDLRHYGFSEGCPRCLDLQAGCYRTDRHHNDPCRLRLYLAYKDANSAKWRRVRHLIDPEPDGDFKQDHVDLEGDDSKTASVALDGDNVLQNSVDHDPLTLTFPELQLQWRRSPL